MPQVTVYIRKDDLGAWEAIEKKSAWIHEHLEESVTVSLSPSYSGIVTKEPTKKEVEKYTGLCPHGFAKGNCKDDNCNRKYRG